MENQLIKYFQKHLDLHPAEIEFLVENVPLVEVNRGEVLLKEGEVSSAFYFVQSGIIRMYYLVDGVEKTTFFYEENDFVSSYESFTRQTPAKHYLQAIQTATVAVFDIQVVSRIISEFPRFEVLSRMVMEKELGIYQDMISCFVTMSATQRYLNLIAHKPHLLNKIPQYDIATYLGVSPETLSRIRKKIKSN